MPWSKFRLSVAVGCRPRPPSFVLLPVSIGGLLLWTVLKRIWYYSILKAVLSSIVCVYQVRFCFCYHSVCWLVERPYELMIDFCSDPSHTSSFQTSLHTNMSKILFVNGAKHWAVFPSRSTFS